MDRNGAILDDEVCQGIERRGLGEWVDGWMDGKTGLLSGVVQSNSERYSTRVRPLALGCHFRGSIFSPRKMALVITRLLAHVKSYERVIDKELKPPLPR